MLTSQIFFHPTSYKYKPPEYRSTYEVAHTVAGDSDRMLDELYVVKVANLQCQVQVPLVLVLYASIQQ